MSQIKNMFSEVQFELVKIILLNVFLSTVIFFLLADLIALIFSMPIWYVVILAAIYFVTMLVLEVRKITVKVVEDRNPELREILRTAKDNVNDESLMAHALFYDVMERMKKVSSGTFLDFQKLMTKLAAIFALAIILVSIAFFNINIAQFENPLAKPMAAVAGYFRGGAGAADPGGFTADENGDIFGEANMAQLGDRALTATINPSLDNPDFNNVDPANPSSDPLADLGGQEGGFASGGPGFGQDGLDERDLERSYEYAKATQGK